MTDKHIVNVYERAKAVVSANRVASGEIDSDSSDQVLVSFNKWHSEKFGWIDHRHGDCANRWEAWKESRESLVIDLPVPYADSPDPLYECAFAQKCRNSIESAGLKVKS